VGYELEQDSRQAHAWRERRWRHVAWVASAILLVGLLVRIIPQEHPASDTPSPRDPSPYPEGRWRQRSFEQLSSVVLWPAHILIRHREVGNSDMSFGFGWWRNAPPPARSRDRARQLAHSLAERLRAEPQQFASFARQYSEDPATADSDGAFGGIAASQLMGWGGVLDSLAVLEAGEISEVIETEYGFHVFKRLPPPPEQEVSGVHLVIGHDDAPWLRAVVPRGNPPKRSRAEAFALARRLAERARADPASFAKLIHEHSEHRDAAHGGDLGSWSTRRTSDFPREVQALAQLPIGGISEPFDSVFGVEVLQRTAPRRRQQYAMRALTFTYDLMSAPGAPNSRGEVLRTAERVLAELAKDSTRFEPLQKEYCCPGPYRFEEGPHYPEVAQQLATLAFGQVSSHLIESGTQFLIPMRIDPAGLPPPPPVIYELEPGS
jgi:hypothetical protein